MADNVRDGVAEALDALAEMPLVDIHLHLDGSISPAIARHLMELGGMTVELSDDELVEHLSVREGCSDLNEYLEKFDFPAHLLESPQQIADCVYLVQEELRELGLIYAELRFAPQRHLAAGLTQREVVEAALEGLRRSELESRLILCMMRGPETHEANLETIRMACDFLGDGVAAVDLAGAEALFPTADYLDLFGEAQRLDVPFTVHAGEAAGPESVRDALSTGTARIGHGVRSIEDPSLVDLLVELGTTLEMCPTSNLNTSVFTHYEEVPLRVLMDAGVRVTINSDNMAVSRTNVRREFEHMCRHQGLTADEMRRLVLNALDVAFVDDVTRARLRAQI